MKCLGKNDELTSLGRILAKLPLEPQLGRMMVLGNTLMLGDALAIIAAKCSNASDIFVFGKFILLKYNNINLLFIIILYILRPKNEICTKAIFW